MHRTQFAPLVLAPLVLAAALVAAACRAAAPLESAAAAAAPPRISECDNFFGQRCRIALATGVRMSYFEQGRPNGEVLILLHTDTTSAFDWAWTADALLRLNPNLHLYALDQRGAGTTDLPQTPVCWQRPNLCMAQTQLAADVLGFMDAKHIGTATLVGHALGAGVARQIALDHPQRVSRLILSGTYLPRRAVPVVSGPQRPVDGLDALGWQTKLRARGVAWPAGALHMRPLDIDADAVDTILKYWDISAVAAPDFVASIAAQTATESLATWGRLDPTPIPASTTDRPENLRVPTLVLWGSEDAGLDRASQDRLIEALRAASRRHRGMSFFWKQYGLRPPPPSGDKHLADDIGHNLCWDAPRELAADIDSFIRTGAPTRDAYHTDFPQDIHRIVTEPGQAVIISSRAPLSGTMDPR